MSKELDFSIPEAGIKSKKSPMKWAYLLLVLLILISAVNTIILLYEKSFTGKTVISPAPPGEKLKQLALKLETGNLMDWPCSVTKIILSPSLA